MLLYSYISRFSVNPHYQQQLYLRPSFIVFFSLSHKWPMFAFTSESGYTLGFRRKIAHNGSHGETGAFPPPGHNATLCCQRNCSVIPLDSAVLLYTYISRSSVNPQHQQTRKIRQSCRYKFYSPTAFHRIFQLLPQAAHFRFHG